MLLVCAFTLAAGVGLRAQTLFTPVQLDNLLAPVALYPDPLLAQVLPASTYPDEIQSAEQWIQEGNDPRYVDDMDWDVSVKSVAHYPSVLSQLANQMDWTTSLGQAYVDQPDYVMDAVQRLRREARAEGNLISNQDQQVLLEGGYIAIDPLQPRYIYVPQYNPQVVYVRRGNLLSFGVGLAIGAWLNYDFHWGSRRIYYTGWQGGGWVGRSRPDVQINNTYYVNNQYRDVPVDRTVINRSVDYNRLSAVRGVHSNVNYTDVATRRRQVAPRVAPQRSSQASPVEARPAQTTSSSSRNVRPAPRAASPSATPAARAPNRTRREPMPNRTAPAPAPNRARPARPEPARPQPQPSRPPETRTAPARPSTTHTAPVPGALPARPAPSRPTTARPERSQPPAVQPAPNRPSSARPEPSRPAPSRATHTAPASRPAPSRPAPPQPAPSRQAPQRTAPPHAAPSHTAPQHSAAPSRGNKNNNKPPDKPKPCCS